MMCRIHTEHHQYKLMHIQESAAQDRKMIKHNDTDMRKDDQNETTGYQVPLKDLIKKK